MGMNTLLWLVPLPPLLAFVLIIFFARRNNALSHTLALVGAGASWLAGMALFIWALSNITAGSPLESSVNWLPIGEEWLKVGVLLDPLSTVALFFVAWTVLMILIYSVGYHNFGQPKGANDQAGLPPQGATIKEHGHEHVVPSVEPMYARFFAMSSLFAFAMLALVVTDNLLVLYMAWEIMGLCSYLLIGFWYGKPSARDAAVKAFMVTRIGDMFMLLGLAGLYALTGTLNFREILANPAVLEGLAAAVSPIAGLSWAGLIGLLLFAGTVGKSAQFPLHVWLPDAMEGPTPVSAMIHAATMVSAGVYLSARFFPLISTGWHSGEALTVPMQVMAWVGVITALLGATIAVTQNDIKRVLAYSTISQLGYMVAALGIGAYGAAVFHLVTHAFFKALLFLGSGSVIHGMEHGVLHTGEHVDPQDMRNMGGLRKRLPVTFWTFVAGGLALSGFPLVTAGFWSKDAILTGAYEGGFEVVFWLLALAALLTAFYTARQIAMTFLGTPRSKAAEFAHEPGRTMTVPLTILAVFAVAAGWAGIPEAFPLLGRTGGDWFAGFVGSGLLEGAGHEAGAHHSLVPLLVSVIVSVGGLALGWLVYRSLRPGQTDILERRLGGLYRFVQSKYYFDEVYNFLFVKPAAWISEVFTSKWVDKGVLDWVLHLIGKLGGWLGGVLRNGFDTPVINGAGDALGNGTKMTGGSMRGMQSGRLQQYMLVTILAVLLTGVIFVFLLSSI